MKLLWQAEEVLRAVRGQSVYEQSWTARGVSIDSRTTKPGDIFIAIKGPDKDAHNFVAGAFASGAAAAIVQRAPGQVPSKVPLIFVEDTFTALQDLGRVGRQRSKAKIIAVTGSVGKTGTKEQLRIILEACGDTHANEGSLNNQWGVPLTLSRLPADARFGIIEMGMNHAGELGPLAREVQPHVGLITNIEAVHLEYFASVEAIADAKAELFLGMNPEGTAILNRDNPHFARLLAATRTQGLKRTLTFGHDPRSDARLIACKPAEGGSSINAVILDQKITYKVGAPGEHIAINSLGALLAATAAGANLETGAEALVGYKAPQGRGPRQIITLASGDRITLIDESFNASPPAVRAAFKILGQTNPGQGGRRIVVLGDMRELGDTAPRLHVDLAPDIESAGIDAVYCCGELMGCLFEALPPGRRGGKTQESTEMAALVASAVRGGDVVMVKGSHSIHMERVVESLKALDKASPSSHKLAC